MGSEKMIKDVTCAIATCQMVESAQTISVTIIVRMVMRKITTDVKHVDVWSVIRLLVIFIVNMVTRRTTGDVIFANARVYHSHPQQIAPLVSHVICTVNMVLKKMKMAVTSAAASLLL